jgi:hypothetical protein
LATGSPYPVVRIKDARPKQTTTAAVLEQLGLVAPEEHFTALPSASFEPDRLRDWPKYEISLAGAKPKKNGDGLDLSGVDFIWCMTAATWGFGVNDTAEMLLQVSEHARHPSNGPRYAKKTADKAAAWVSQRREQRTARHRYG